VAESAQAEPLAVKSCGHHEMSPQSTSHQQETEIQGSRDYVKHMEKGGREGGRMLSSEFFHQANREQQTITCIIQTPLPLPHPPPHPATTTYTVHCVSMIRPADWDAGDCCCCCRSWYLRTAAVLWPMRNLLITLWSPRCNP